MLKDICIFLNNLCGFKLRCRPQTWTFVSLLLTQKTVGHKLQGQLFLTQTTVGHVQGSYLMTLSQY